MAQPYDWVPAEGRAFLEGRNSKFWAQYDYRNITILVSFSLSWGSVDSVCFSSIIVDLT